MVLEALDKFKGGVIAFDEEQKMFHRKIEGMKIGNSTGYQNREKFLI